MRKDTRSDLLVLINTLDNVDDLREVKTMVVDKLESLGRQTKYDLVIGEEVKISGSGRIDSGKIIKINRTRAVVDCYDKRNDRTVEFTVPFSMIRKIYKEGESNGENR
tara:strand:- start:528 stop:851 length:324 start_codon:yes stop_codon:yes gene_type:complete